MSALKRGTLYAFVLASAMALGLGATDAGASDGTLDVIFSFDPAQASYCPGEEFALMVTVTNMMPSDEYVYDDLAYMQKVVNVSVHFSWMAPNVYAWSNVSNESSWLEPDGVGSETYEVGLAVPDDVACATYSYSIKVEYMTHTPWYNLTFYWGVGETYRDFVVETEGDAGIEGTEAVDLTPYFAFVAVILSLGAVAAVIYHRQTGSFASAQGSRAGLLETQESYPAIRPLPGEHFPVEKGFLYLVKEKRPRVAFQMFNEAVQHGATGMLVVREHPNRLRHINDFQAEKILWLTRRTGVDHIDPTELSLLNLKITKFVEGRKKAVVMIEGIEYMITQNDFESVLRFVNHLHDFVLTHDCAVILVIDSRVLSTRELALLERATKHIGPFEEDLIPPEEEAS